MGRIAGPVSLSPYRPWANIWPQSWSAVMHGLATAWLLSLPA
ncbi:hypothetical protein HMPREF9946_00858 [Acetobacteraceae bacterium AT-5844]|nr:hypothetical protein HMPREF9946_00858 [Acetobacteraceae bacterium AT-5844]